MTNKSQTITISAQFGLVPMNLVNLLLVLTQVFSLQFS